MPRTLEELLSADSAWPFLLDLFDQSPHDVRVIDASEDRRSSALLAAQVTTRSPLGALAWNCGAVAIDHGWVRLHGAGVGSLSGVHPERLEEVESARGFDGVIVAHDVLGGQFAIHGGGLDEVPLGEVAYWAPDTLHWTGTGLVTRRSSNICSRPDSPTSTPICGGQDGRQKPNHSPSIRV